LNTTKRNNNHFRHEGQEAGANPLEVDRGPTRQGQDQGRIRGHDLIRRIPRDLDHRQYQEEKDRPVFSTEEESLALESDQSRTIGRRQALPRRTAVGRVRAGAGAEAVVAAGAGAGVRGINTPGHAADLSLREETVICSRSSQLSRSSHLS